MARIEVDQREVPWGVIREDRTLPNGVYRFRLEELVKAPTKGGDGAQVPEGTLQYRAGLRITAAGPYGEAFIGQIYNANFLIGTKDDPPASLPQTWAASSGPKRLDAMLTALGAPRTMGNLYTRAVAAGDREFDGRLTNTVSKRGGHFNDLAEMAPAGQMKLEVTDKEFIERFVKSGAAMRGPGVGNLNLNAPFVAPTPAATPPPPPTLPNGAPALVVPCPACTVPVALALLPSHLGSPACVRPAAAPAPF